MVSPVEKNKSKTALVKLDGTMIKADGSEYKSDFFKFLDIHPDDYSDISYTEKEAQQIRGHLMHLATGASAAIPLICGGVAKCPFQERCPFVRIDKKKKADDPKAKPITPVGRQCLVEINLLNEWTRMFIYEYEIDAHQFTEYSMVRELAEIELMLWRLNNNLAKPEHAELVQNTVVGLDREGNPLMRMEMRSQEDPSSNAAQLRGKLDKLLREVNSLDIKVKESEGKIIDAEVLPIEAEVIETLTPEDLIGKE